MKKIRLIAIAKNEAAYLTEWIHHHLFMGFDEISIVLNDCSDNSYAILNQIAKNNTAVKFTDGDSLKSDCLKNGIDFQREAYKQELAKARTDSNLTHLMFLDIDEFWVSTNPRRNIQNYLHSFDDSDSISFMWHVETPENNQPFSRAIRSSYSVQKNKHVKSLHKISDRLSFIDIHNAIHTNGKYILFDGRIFPDCHYNNSPRAGVPSEIFESTISEPDEAFIYHRIFRSEIEYLATLHRGRPGPYMESIKTNRWGYATDDPSVPVIKISHDSTFIELLLESEKKFIEHNNLSSLIEAGRIATLERYKAISGYASNPTHEIHKYEYLFLGITDSHFISHLYPSIVYHIDKVSILGDSLLIAGWAGDKRSNRQVILDTAPWISEVTFIERPDVAIHHPRINGNCGFNLRIHITDEYDLPKKINMSVSNFNSQLKNPICEVEIDYNKLNS